MTTTLVLVLLAAAVVGGALIYRKNGKKIESVKDSLADVVDKVSKK